MASSDDGTSGGSEGVSKAWAVASSSAAPKGGKRLSGGVGTEGGNVAGGSCWKGGVDRDRSGFLGPVKSGGDRRGRGAGHMNGAVRGLLLGCPVSPLCLAHLLCPRGIRLLVPRAVSLSPFPLIVLHRLRLGACVSSRFDAVWPRRSQLRRLDGGVVVPG
jgi:hypothetical protein